MIAYQKIVDLLEHYLERERTVEESEKFCNSFMDMFYELSDALENEITQEIFEKLDDINLICDSYESNEDIRREDKYCIDETQLKDKVSVSVQEIKALVSKSI